MPLNVLAPGGSSASLRRWLVLLVLGTTLPLVVFALLTVLWMTHSHRRAQDASQADTTRALSLAVDAEVRSWKAAAAALAISNDLQTARLDIFYEEARPVAAELGGWVAVIDRSGQQLLNTRVPLGTPLPKTNPLALRVFEAKQALALGIYADPVARRPAVSVVTPVVRDGAVAYAVILGFEPARLGGFLAAQRLGPGSQAAIVDADNRIIAASTPSDLLSGAPYPSWLQVAVSQAESGAADDLLAAGRPGHVAFRRIQEAPWTVVLGVPKGGWNDIWARPLLVFIVAGSLLSLVAVWMAAYVGLQVTRPIVRAAEGGAAMLRGEAADFGPPARVAEVQQLQRALLAGIAARNEAEARLADNERLLQAIIEQAADGITVRDAEGRLIFVNTAAQRLAHRPAERTSLHEAPAIWGETRDVAGNLLPVDGWPISRALRGETVRGTEWHRTLPDGTQHVVLNSAAPLKDGTGTIIGAVAITTDITERKRAEDALARAKDELERRVQERTAELSRSLEALRAEMARRKAAETELRARSERLRSLASELTVAEQRERQRLAHVLHDELQQLLVGAKYRVSRLERTDLPVVRTACRDLQALLDECVGVSRSLTGELSPPVLQMAGLFPALEWLTRWMDEKHGLQVALQIDAAASPASDVLQALLFQSVRELLFNVVKHAQVDRARVEVTQSGGELAISVCDAGAGFAPEAVAPDAKAGAGFGLFSIGERLQYLGGRMEMESTPGKGSRITLFTPIADAAEAPPEACEPVPAREVRRAAPRGRSPKSVSPLRLLLVDDHTVMREGLARLLDAEPDLEIVGEASSGREAVGLADQLRPDVVLMDVEMVGMNGDEATRRIRASQPAVQVIALSMHDKGGHAETSMRQAGAADYLTKSGPSEDLLAAIRGCAARRPQG